MFAVLCLISVDSHIHWHDHNNTCQFTLYFPVHGTLLIDGIQRDPSCLNEIYIIIHLCVSNNDGVYSWIIHVWIIHEQFGKEAKVSQNQVHNHDRRTERLRSRRDRQKRRDSITNWRKERRRIRKAEIVLEKGEQERETDVTLIKWYRMIKKVCYFIYFAIHQAPLCGGILASNC